MQIGGFSMEARKAKAAPILASLCADLDVAGVIDRHVQWDAARTKLSPGTSLVAMIINFLVDRRPLYKISRFYRDMDCAWLLGEGVSADLLHDDRLADALDKLADADPWRIYHQIALGTPEAAACMLDGLMHLDTTSISVQGSYEEAALQNSPLRIVHGYSKDLRPDLKQFLYGLGSCGGIPLWADVMDGNTSDKAWYGDLTKRVESLLSPEAWNSLIVVADSAFVTRENLSVYEKRSFISRLPETYGLCKTLKDQAWEQEEQFIDIGTLRPESKKAARYKIQGFEEELYDHRYRFVVVQSSQLDERKAKRLAKAVEEEARQLADRVQSAIQTIYHCEPDAVAGLEQCLRENKPRFHRITGQIVPTIVETRRRGRPPKHDPDRHRVRQAVWQIRLQVETDPAAVERQRCREGTFVLMSNVEPTRRTDEMLLRGYKSQIQVENLFRAVKQPYLMHGVFLKTPKRVLAMAYVMLLALLVYALLQQRVRQGLAAEREQNPLVLNGVKVTSPTGRTILEEFDDVLHLVIRMPDGRVVHQLQGLTEGGVRMLRWLQLNRRPLLTEAGLAPVGS